MVMPEAKIKGKAELVKNTPPSKLDIPIKELLAKSETNRGNRREAVPYIRQHKVKGHIYYSIYYGPGIPEYYLGSLEYIKKLVVKDKGEI